MRLVPPPRLLAGALAMTASAEDFASSSIGFIERRPPVCDAMRGICIAAVIDPRLRNHWFEAFDENGHGVLDADELAPLNAFIAAPVLDLAQSRH